MVSIMKDTFGINNSKAKLTLNPAQPDQMNLVRIYKYIFTNVDYDKSQSSIIKYLEALKFEELVYLGGRESVIEEKNISKTSDEFLNENTLCFKAKYLDGKDICIFVSLDNTIKKTHAGSVYSFNTPLLKKEVPHYFIGLNINRLYAIYSIISSPQFKPYEDIYIRNFNMTEKLLRTILQRLIIVDKYYKGKVYFNDEYKMYFHIMFKFVSTLYRKELNYKLMEDYEKGRKSEYATVFQTKKNITQKVQKEMTTSPYLKYFKFVELDNDVDIEKYRATLPHFEQLIKEITFPMKKNDLRFRKLGKLSVANSKVNGVYFPGKNCIAVDIRNVSSFLHEVAHSIDYNMGKNGVPLSLQDDFQHIIEVYTNQFSILAQQSELPARAITYYVTPTEIFARGFELAYVLKGKYNILVGDKSKFNDIQFRAFKGLEDELKKYYSKFIK